MSGISPCECESLTDLLSLDSTHKSVGRFDLMIQHDQALIFTEQLSGEPCRSQIVIPKHVFRQMIEWYDKQQQTP